MAYHSCCIIPVRGGSKGIPRKNLQDFGGVSLLEWTIRQAKEVFADQDIWVSTEDSELAAIAKACGVGLVERPHELAQDDSTSNSVVAHLLETIDPDAKRYQGWTLLQVTSPLRNVQDIRSAEAMMHSGSYDSVVSVFQETHAHPAKMYVIDGEYAVSVAPQMQASRRQDLPAVYRRNGAIFSCTRDWFVQSGALWGGRMGMVEMPEQRSVDIDSPEDLQRARALIAEATNHAS